MDQTFLIFRGLGIFNGLTDKSYVRGNLAQHSRNILYAFNLVVKTLSIGQEIEDSKLEGKETSDKHMAIKDGHKTQHTPDMLSNSAARL